jgi:hypothetical protein
MRRWLLVCAVTVAALVGGVLGYAYSGCWEGATCSWWGPVSGGVASVAAGALLIGAAIAFLWLTGTAIDAVAAVVRRRRRE